MRPRRAAVAMVVVFVLAGCGALGAPRGFGEGRCAAGTYSADSLDRWFRVDWNVTEGKGGPVVAGYIYNSYSLWADRMLLAVERLDAAGRVTGCRQVWVGNVVPPENRAYFEAAVPDANAKYRVRILAFDWVGRGGGA